MTEKQTPTEILLAYINKLPADSWKDDILKKRFELANDYFIIILQGYINRSRVLTSSNNIVADIQADQKACFELADMMIVRDLRDSKKLDFLDFKAQEAGEIK